MYKMKIAILIVLIGLIAGCVSTHYSLHPNAKLSDYRYVVIIKSDHDPFELHTELSALFSQAGFSIVSEAKKEKIPLQERDRVLFCMYEYSNVLMNTKANIALYDYAMDGAVFSGTGEYGLGMDKKNNALRAVEQAFWGISEEYSR